MSWRTVLSASGLALALACVASTLAWADSSRPQVIPPAVAAAVTGRDYAEWSAVWWKTMLALPKSQSPILHDDMCQNGDTRSIFFLAGAGSTTPTARFCRVPSDKPVFLPIINTECSNVEAVPFFGATDLARAACAAAIVNTTNRQTLVVTLDGLRVSDPIRLRAASPPFGFRMPAIDNFLDLRGVTSGRSASDGFWLLLRPLSRGRHVLHFEAEFLSKTAPFSQNVTYYLSTRDNE